MLPVKTILNVNIPDLPLEEIRGLAVTRLGTRHGAEQTVRDTDPRGKTVYWIGPPGSEADASPGTDFHAINQGFVSITPLQLDMTHYKVLETLSTWVDGVTFK